PEVKAPEVKPPAVEPPKPPPPPVVRPASDLKRAQANLSPGKYAEAIEQLKAERAAGDSPEVATALADAYVSDGKPDDALRELEKSGARNAAALAIGARALMRKGDAKGAAARFEEAAKLDPKLGESLSAEAEQALERGTPSRALA